MSLCAPFMLRWSLSLRGGAFWGAGEPWTSDMAKPKVSDQYKETDGTDHDRASIQDFQTVRSRIFARIIRHLGNENADHVVLPGVNAYNTGNYIDALRHYEEAARLFPVIREEIAPHMEFCRRVLSVTLDEHDHEYDLLLAQWRRKPRLLRWILEKIRSRSVPILQLRCKWCGHFTQFVDPSSGWAYMNGNNCTRCGRGYPMPDFGWDGLDGQAYSYYRGSVTKPVFYQEFEEKYDVDPVMRVIDGKWNKIARVDPRVKAWKE